MAMEIKEQNYSNLEQVNTEKEVQTKAVKKETEKKSTYGSRREYSEYLSHKYACLTPTKDSSVTINSSLLSKAASNPKTAEWLENTLSQMPDCINKICENTVATHLSCPKINQIDCHRMSRYNGISLKKGKVPGHLQFRHR